MASIDRKLETLLSQNENWEFIFRKMELIWNANRKPYPAFEWYHNIIFNDHE